MSKVLQFPLVRIVLAIFFVGAGIAIGQVLLNLLRAAFSITDTAIANVLALVLIVPAVYLAYRAYVHFIEKRELTELGSGGAAREFGLGFLIGFGLFTSVVVVLWLLGVYHVSGTDFVFLSLVGALCGAFVSAFAQEMIFRVALYRITEEWLGTWSAVVISAALFGLIHLTSAGATLWSAVTVALQAGVLLAAAYVLTHRLWLALGLHMAWDFANDGVFGVGLAGQTGQTIHGLLRASLSGSDILAGGAFGIETSIVSFVITLVAGVVALWIAYRKGRFVVSIRPARNMRDYSTTS